jgi:aryl-alcohol dehydrogenase-like predicted oxidoreductase
VHEGHCIWHDGLFLRGRCVALPFLGTEPQKVCELIRPDAGGNFIDTSNNYQGEESEEWIGEWMTARKNREQMVIATKYTTAYPNPAGPNPPKWMVNYQGQHAKSLKVSVEASLRKLQTDYIDLLYIHWWDFTTTIPEIMQSLNHLVVQGKVLYLGISDTPAWVVSKANQYARDHNLRQFSVYQGKWNAAERDFERGTSLRLSITRPNI